MRFVITCDDAGHSGEGIQARAEDFFESQAVRASFFAVPHGKSGALGEDKTWLAAAHEAEQRGHDFQLHALDHSVFEFGWHPEWMMALTDEETRRHFAEEREEIARGWGREILGGKLRTAIQVFEDAFGRRPLVFRSGALSQSPELYQALGDAGIPYSSNQVVNPGGWSYIAGNYDSPLDWDPAVPPRPYQMTGQVVEIPMISEYAWKLTPEKVDRHLALAKKDLRRVSEAGGVFVLICHVQCVGAEEPLARDLLTRLFQEAWDSYSAEFMTLREFIALIESVVVPVGNRDDVPDGAR